MSPVMSLVIYLNVISPSHPLLFKALTWCNMWSVNLGYCYKKLTEMKLSLHIF